MHSRVAYYVVGSAVELSSRRTCRDVGDVFAIVPAFGRPVIVIRRGVCCGRPSVDRPSVSGWRAMISPGFVPTLPPINRGGAIPDLDPPFPSAARLKVASRGLSRGYGL